MDPYLAEKSTYNSEHPENMPEVRREVTMIRGALDGLSRRWEELVMQLQPIKLQRPEIVGPHDSTSPDPFSVFSPLGKELREIHDEVSAMENRISMFMSELGL